MNKFIQKIKERIYSNAIIQNYILVLLGQNIGSIFSIISLIFTLRIITADEYGVLIVIQAYCLLISGLVSFRTFNGVIKFVTESI